MSKDDHDKSLANFLNAEKKCGLALNEANGIISAKELRLMG